MKPELKVDFESVQTYAKEIIKYSDSRIMIIDGLHAMEEMRLYADAYITVLCTNGTAQFKTLETSEQEIVKNDIALCHPNQFYEHIRTSLDFKCQGVLFAPEYFEQLICDKYYSRRAIEEHPIIHLTPEEADEMLHDFEYVKFKMNSKCIGKHRNDVMDNLFLALINSSADILMRHMERESSSKQYTSGANLTNKFIALVDSETPQKREVKTYADMLCVTPKYLSSVCRRETGMTARELICQKVQKKIRRMLTDPDMTVKQVAELCGFDNLSFFGKYVKRELGMSPRGVRRGEQV